MFYKFILSNRAELIVRCRRKVSSRYEPEQIPQVVDHGVPLFLQQLIDTLRREQSTTIRPVSGPSPAPTAIGRAATAHGTELLRLGYTVDQVVHNYGDVCQAVTEMAVLRNEEISPDEFRTLNRCVDEAIADAVLAYTDERESISQDQSAELHQRLGVLAEEQRRLVNICLQTLAAIQTGSVGIGGATASALVKTLSELRDLIDRTLPEIRLVSGMTQAADPAARNPLAH